MISLTKGKYIVGGLWFSGFLLLFILMTIQTISGNVYADKSKEAWEWLTPHLLPTMGLIIGVLIADWQNPAAVKTVKIKTMLIVGTVILSFLYLAILLYAILNASNKETVNETFAALKTANLPLGVIQGLVALTLGIFFKK